MKIVGESDDFDYSVNKGDNEITLSASIVYRVFNPKATQMHNFQIDLTPSHEDFSTIAKLLGEGNHIRITLEIGDEL